MGHFKDMEFPSAQEKEKSIALIVSQGVKRPKKLGSMLLRMFQAAGLKGICCGVWDSMLLALLLDGILWAAVYVSAGKEPQLFYLLVFLASPVLYALLHFLTVWKEMMTGTYQVLMVCRLSLQQMTALRMLLFGGVSVIAICGMHAAFGVYFKDAVRILRLAALSLSALFFYAFSQVLIEWKWKSRKAVAAAPILWSSFCMVLLLLGERGQWVLDEIPVAALFVCAGLCAVLYLGTLRKYFFEPCGAAVSIAG